MASNKQAKSNLEECVDTIRDIIHKCNRHQKLEALYGSLAQSVRGTNDHQQYWTNAREESENFEKTWRKVRPALTKLLEAEAGAIIWPCPRCQARTYTIPSAVDAVKVDCTLCDATGNILSTTKLCAECEGYGMVNDGDCAATCEGCGGKGK